ncbi:hypothetical protein DFP72DRAFT_1076669 [Ephemerocybe angulata]|uniref:Uncharacterized protein n=1 Tax=Ephemerocybe angulata TaxID=980116 RepID=A0A8H6HFX0_9AGAR|nr:hypothetical protein DFP72DRAFT_1076669 [Tulosesus angulatus]
MASNIFAGDLVLDSDKEEVALELTHWNFQAQMKALNNKLDAKSDEILALAKLNEALRNEVEVWRARSNELYERFQGPQNRIGHILHLVFSAIRSFDQISPLRQYKQDLTDASDLVEALSKLALQLKNAHLRSRQVLLSHLPIEGDEALSPVSGEKVVNDRNAGKRFVLDTEDVIISKMICASKSYSVRAHNCYEHAEQEASQNIRRTLEKIEAELQETYESLVPWTSH